MESQIVRISEASKILGESPNTIRIRMERNSYNPPIGYCVPSVRGDRINHKIYRPMLNKYLGIEDAK